MHANHPVALELSRLVRRGFTPKKGALETNALFQPVRFEGCTACEDGGTVVILSFGPRDGGTVVDWPEGLSTTPWLVLPALAMAKLLEN